jgi:hypothetical protein
VVHFCYPLTLVTGRRPFRGIMVRMDEAIRTRLPVLPEAARPV